MEPVRPDGGALVIDADGLDELISALISYGYRVIGPTLRENAIVLSDLRSAADLPAGWSADTGPGHYRLRQRADTARFGHCAGPQSWKQFLHPPRQRVWSGCVDGTGDSEPSDSIAPLAFLGVHGCDLAAIATLDRVLAATTSPDSAYLARRRRLFVVAVDCTEPGDVCFCASAGTGPQVRNGYDLALTERPEGDDCRYLVTVGSADGAQILTSVSHHEAPADDLSWAAAALRTAAQNMGRQLPQHDLRTLLAESRESSNWDDVASRCLTCGNCTMVCPTCFCTSVEDVSDLTGRHAERWMSWSSCFDLDFSELHDGPVRRTGAARYRQWLTHKFSTWHDQFGSSGCTGCGRCIAWCPTGIDVTEELAKLAAPHQREGDG
jgi:ferredoxin